MWIPAFLVGLVVASGAQAAATGAVRCSKLLDVRAGRMLTDQMVLFQNGMVTDSGPAGSMTVPAGATPLDIKATCLPGLIDAHVHLTSDPSHAGYQGLGVSIPRETVIGVRNARITLRAGFTTVRNVGAPGFSDVALRDGINAGDIDGPRMLVSGPPLGITGGHADENLLPYEYHDRMNIMTGLAAWRTGRGRPAPRCGKTSNMGQT